MPRPSAARASSPRQQRLVVVKWEVVDAWRKSRGYTEADFCEQLHLGKETYRRVKRGDGVEISTAGKLADVMGLSDVRELLDGDDGVTILPSKSGAVFVVNEWEVVESLSDPIKASNGLLYRVFKMRNHYSQEQLARGKRYELDGLYDRERDRVEACFKRHSDVCRRVRAHPNLPMCYRSSPDSVGHFWWIIDSWPGGRMLSEQLNGKPLPPKVVHSLMRQVGEALQALHAVDVVRRELAPRNIYFDAATESVVLTDFELGKLLDTSITVSKDQWPVDAYRAPEVGKGRAKVAADLFSWGRVFIHAATGSLPPDGHEEAIVRRLLLPRSLCEQVLSCVEPVPANRPDSLAPVLKALSAWL